MTIDEAPEAIKKTDRCLISWDSTTGELEKVFPIELSANAADIQSLVKAAQLHETGPLATSLFDAATLTREVLLRLQSETRRVVRRIKILQAWSIALPGELLSILESCAYPPYMAKVNDSRILVDHLWRLHSDELTLRREERMSSLLEAGVLSHSASFNCNAYALALGGESAHLRPLWKSGAATSFAEMSVLMECFCQVQLQDSQITDDLIGQLHQSNLPFGARFETMMTLGSLNAARDTNAAATIGEVIHDSTPEISVVKRRALERLTTTAASRTKCEHCCHVRVHGAACVGVVCPTCLGFGTVPS